MTKQEPTIAKIKVNPIEFGITETKGAEISAQFKPMLDKIVELENELNAVTVLDPDDYETTLKAKALRLKYVKVRTGVAAIHKEQKAFYLAGGRFVDGWKNAYTFATEGIEASLEKIEKHYEIKEEARIAKLSEERAALLIPYGVENLINLGSMDANIWDNYLAGVRANFEKAEADRLAAEKKAEEERIEAEKKAEEDRIAAEKKAEEDRIERERIEAENAKLKKEAELKAKEQADNEAKIKAEADKKVAAEKAKADALKAEIEARDKKEADAKAAEEAAKANAEKAPDKQKLFELTRSISSIKYPELKTEEAKKILTAVRSLLEKVVNYANEKAEGL